MILYRPVSLEELALIYDSGMKAFPTRLPKQPIFYPVLDLEYARKTASKWNVKNGQFAGYVTEFKVEDDYINKFEKHTVGKSQHQEFWIPAEEVEEFNKHIVGHIKAVEAYFGDAFQGFIPDQFGLQGKNAVEQFTLLSNSYLYKRMEFYLEIKRNHKAVFLNYPFWHTHDFKNPGLKEKVLQAIKEAWFTSFPKIPLANPVQDTKPVKETDLLSSENSLEQENTSLKQNDSNPVVNRVEKDVTPKRQISTSSIKPEQAITPAKRRDASSSVKPDADEDTPKAPSTTSLVKPPNEQITLAEQEDSHSSVKPGNEPVSPLQQSSSPPLVPPVRQSTPPIKRTNSHFLGRSARADLFPAQESVPNVQKPKQIDSRVVHGVGLGLRGEYQEAIEELTQAVQENPRNVVAQTSLGVAYHRLGEDGHAFDCYEAALKTDPKYAEAHYFRANILYEHGDIREAIAGYTMAFGLDPDLIDAHQKPIPQDRLTDYTSSPSEIYRIATTAHRILDLTRSLETNPRQANLLKERAAQYSKLWNYEQAIANYSAALKIQPDDASTLHLRGLAYEQLGQNDRALEDFERAIALNPQLSDIYISRGVTFGKAGNFRQSIDSLSKAIGLAPKNADAHFNRGITYFYQGDLESAIEDFSTVIQLSPKDDAAYYWRGISHEEAGHRREAIADYKEFLTLSQDAHTREEVEERLNQWNEGTRNIAPEDRQKTTRAESPKQAEQIDLHDLIAALGERALNSIWFGIGAQCYGEKAKELYSFTEHNRSISGRDLLPITSGIEQTIEGDFTAFDPDATAHWLFIRAWGGSGFYIETNDPKSKQRLKTRFPSIEEVEGAYAPYESLFIPN